MVFIMKGKRGYNSIGKKVNCGMVTELVIQQFCCMKQKAVSYDFTPFPSRFNPEPVSCCFKEDVLVLFPRVNLVYI